MAVIGFREYREGDRYKTKRALGRTSNVIWKVVGAIVIVGAIVFVIKVTVPWRQQVFSAINDTPSYIH